MLICIDRSGISIISSKVVPKHLNLRVNLLAVLHNPSLALKVEQNPIPTLDLLHWNSEYLENPEKGESPETVGKKWANISPKSCSRSKFLESASAANIWAATS